MQDIPKVVHDDFPLGLDGTLTDCFEIPGQSLRDAFNSAVYLTVEAQTIRAIFQSPTPRSIKSANLLIHGLWDKIDPLRETIRAVGNIIPSAFEAVRVASDTVVVAWIASDVEAWGKCLLDPEARMPANSIHNDNWGEIRHALMGRRWPDSERMVGQFRSEVANYHTTGGGKKISCKDGHEKSKPTPEEKLKAYHEKHGDQVLSYTIRQLSDATGISTGKIHSTDFWKQCMAYKQSQATAKIVEMKGIDAAKRREKKRTYCASCGELADVDHSGKRYCIECYADLSGISVN